MSARPSLRAVDKPAEAPVDITLAMRAEIMARDWAAVHVRGDRSPPLLSWERVRRTWLR
jgi:hypothetical protein